MPLLNLKGYYVVESLEKDKDCIYCSFYHQYKSDTSWHEVVSLFDCKRISGFCSLPDFSFCPLAPNYYFQKVHSQLSFADVHESDSDKK